MAKKTQRPYIPFGHWEKKRDATEHAKQLPYRCVPVKSKSGSGYSLCREDK